MPKLGEVRIISPDIEFFNVDAQLKIINHMSPVYPIVPYKPKRYLVGDEPYAVIDFEDMPPSSVLTIANGIIEGRIELSGNGDIKDLDDVIALIGTGGSTTPGTGQIAVGVFDNTLANTLSTNVTKIVWRTQGLGFTAQVDPATPGVVYIGPAAVFKAKFPSGLAPIMTKDARVSEQVTYGTGGKENTVVKSSNAAQFVYATNRITGMGSNSKLNVLIKLQGVIAVDTDLVTDQNGEYAATGIGIKASQLAMDGDGSAKSGILSVNVQPSLLFGAGKSGFVEIKLKFTDVTGSTETFQDSFYYDQSSQPLVIASEPVLEVPEYNGKTVLKYLSGIAYYTVGSKFRFAALDVDGHNRDTSKPDSSFVVDGYKVGQTLKATSPWQHPLKFNGLSNLNTLSDLQYADEVEVQQVNYRHLDEADIELTVSDVFQASVQRKSNVIPVAVDTYIDNSTTSEESFNGEAKRLKGDYVTPWDSKPWLDEGHAAVFGGKLMHPQDVHKIKQGSDQALGSASNVAPYLPAFDSSGQPVTQPNYSLYVKPAVYFRRFKTPETTRQYPQFKLFVNSTGDLRTLLRNGDIKIYIWKEASSDVSVNTTVPPEYDPVAPELQLANSLWVTGQLYSFGAFTDGAVQTIGGANCSVKFIGSNQVNCTFGGFNCEQGILMRVEVKKGTTIDSISVDFT